MTLRGKNNQGELTSGPTFAKAASKFEQEYDAITVGRRSPKWVQGHKDRIRLHLMPCFGKKAVKDITSGSAQEYRAHRITEPEGFNDGDEDKPAWKPTARNTIHNEMVTLNMVLKTAQRHGWVEHLPDLSDPYRRQSKIEHRPWFTPNEYEQLYQATRKNAADPKSTRYKWHAEQLHDLVLFMANTGLRPDEVKHTEFRDVEIVDDDYSGEQILLADNKLKFDRHGKARTAYSLRHSYICFRLLEGADIYQVAKNCRTSVEMIERHYAAHLKDMIDTPLVNVRREKTVLKS